MLQYKNSTQVERWECILSEEALLAERRSRACASNRTKKSRNPKLNKQVVEDLIAENQRLHTEIHY